MRSGWRLAWVSLLLGCANRPQELGLRDGGALPLDHPTAPVAAQDRPDVASSAAAWSCVTGLGGEGFSNDVERLGDRSVTAGRPRVLWSAQMIRGGQLLATPHDLRLVSTNDRCGVGYDVPGGSMRQWWGLESGVIDVNPDAPRLVVSRRCELNSYRATNPSLLFNGNFLAVCYHEHVAFGRVGDIVCGRYLCPTDAGTGFCPTLRVPYGDFAVGTSTEPQGIGVVVRSADGRARYHRSDDLLRARSVATVDVADDFAPRRLVSDGAAWWLTGVRVAEFPERVEVARLGPDGAVRGTVALPHDGLTALAPADVFRRERGLVLTLTGRAADDPGAPASAYFAMVCADGRARVRRFAEGVRLGPGVAMRDAYLTFLTRGDPAESVEVFAQWVSWSGEALGAQQFLHRGYQIVLESVVADPVNAESVAWLLFRQTRKGMGADANELVLLQVNLQ